MNKIIFAGLAALLLLPFAAEAYPPQDKQWAACASCHKLEKKEAEAIVKKIPSLPAGAVVTDIKPSPLKGVWMIEVEAEAGKRGALYLDYAKKHLIAGQIVPVEALGKKPEPRKVDYSKLPLGDAVVLGAKDAKKKIAVFSDPDCPYCRKLHEEMKKVLEKRGDVAFHIFLYPLPMHKDAYKKSQAVLCEKSGALLDDAFSGKSVPEPKCSNEKLEKALALGKEYRVEGTPALVRPDGLVLSGYLPADKLIEWIDGKDAK